MFSKLKTWLMSKSTRAKSTKWVLILILLVAAFWSFRSCSKTVGFKKQIYYIARDSRWYPFELYGKEKNFIAFTNDLLYYIANENNLKFEWAETSSTTLLSGLNSGYYDFMLSTWSPTTISQETYDFSIPLYRFGPVLIVEQSSKITSLTEMQGDTIGIPAGLSPIFEEGKEGGTIAPWTLIPYDNMYRALEALRDDQIDGVIMPAFQAYNMTQGLYAGKLKVVTPPLTNDGLRLVSPKESGNEAIIELINASLNKMKEDGAYDALIAKWNLVDPAHAYWHPNKKVE